MRLTREPAQIEQHDTISVFSKWLLDPGDGKLSVLLVRVSTTVLGLRFQKTFLLEPTVTRWTQLFILSIEIYRNAIETIHSYLRECAILTPTNEVVNEINLRVLSMAPVEVMIP